MKKRYLTLAMAACMICCLMTSCSAAEIPAANSGADAEDTALRSETQGGASFDDIPDGAWYAEAVNYCRQHGIMSGTTATTFAPEDSLTRAMLAAVLYRMSGSPVTASTPAFIDVEAGAWYSGAVAWAAESKVISGYGNGNFGAEDPTTREQAVTILWRYAGSPESGTADSFSDAGSISEWAKAAVRWANANGILEGMTENDRFDPETNIQRGEVASVLYHYLNLDQQPADCVSGTKIDVSFNGHTYPATLADNTSAEAFAELLKSGPLTVPAHDYGSFEKVGALGTTLPRNDEQITTSAGDIILYQGDQITVYYAENSWSFTRLGRIDDPSGLREAFGGGDVTITFTLADTAAPSR